MQAFPLLVICHPAVRISCYFVTSCYVVKHSGNYIKDIRLLELRWFTVTHFQHSSHRSVILHGRATKGHAFEVDLQCCLIFELMTSGLLVSSLYGLITLTVRASVNVPLICRQESQRLINWPHFSRIVLTHRVSLLLLEDNEQCLWTDFLYRLANFVERWLWQIFLIPHSSLLFNWLS